MGGGGSPSTTVIAHQWQLAARAARALERAGNGAHLITAIHHARGHKTDTQPRSYTHKWESLRDTCVCKTHAHTHTSRYAQVARAHARTRRSLAAPAASSNGLIYCAAHLHATAHHSRGHFFSRFPPPPPPVNLPNSLECLFVHHKHTRTNRLSIA